MEDLQDKIIELMDLFDDEQVTTADKIDRDDFMKRNPMAGGGMLVKPSADGSRPGYSGSKLYEKYSQYFFKKPYSEIKPNTKEYYKIHNAIKRDRTKFMAPKSKKGIRFRKELENKILKAYPNADFEKYGRFGFPKTTGTREQYLNYTRVRDFIARGFKTGVRDKLPVAVQRAIMIKFENDVPKNFKWDFNKANQKYGIPETSKGGKYEALGKRIINFVNNPTPEHRLWNYQTPEGWMMSVMNRNFMQYGDEYYEPLFDKVNGKNTIVGFKDKTNFGKGKDYYYGIKRAKDKNGVHVRNHPDFDNTKKYFNIASKIKDPPNKTIQKILKQGNVTIDGRLTLNNLLNYLINEKGRIQTNRALVLHHKGGLKLRATGDYQLLDRLTNAKITGVEDAMRSGDITKENIDFLKKNNASVIIDGVTYGGGPKTAEEGFKQTEKFVEKKLKKEIKTDPQLKNFKKFLGNLVANSKLSKCAVEFKAEGGRIGFKFSDECIRDGLNETKKAAAAGDKKAARQLVETAEAASKGGRLLKNVLGPGAILGEAVFEGAIIGNKVLGGKPLKQAWAESYLSYLDPRKYSGQLDPTLLQREQMLESSADKNILQSGFDAQDRISAFNEARRKEELAEIRQRPDQLMTEAEREKLRAYEKQSSPFIKDSQLQKDADIISSEAFKDASNIAQEYIQGQEGKQRFDLGILGTPRGELSEDRRMFEANKAMKNLYTQFSDTQLMDMLKNSKSLKAAGISPEQYMLLLGAGTKRITPAVTRTLSGLDAVRTDIQEQEALNRIAEAGGVANLAKGGRAGYKLGKLIKVKPSKVREDVKAIIDDSMKMQQEIDTTTELDKLIKKTLDEDLFDKKDRIVDSINISEAKKRRNYPYNMQVFEEPKNLDFYRDIKESNFRTKTGPYYDRIRRLNKAGGGLLKQAGDRSGPPPESGPNPQGLQGVLNRVKKT